MEFSSSSSVSLSAKWSVAGCSLWVDRGLDFDFTSRTINYHNIDLLYAPIPLVCLSILLCKCILNNLVGTQQGNFSPLFKPPQVVIKYGGSLSENIIFAPLEHHH